MAANRNPIMAVVDSLLSSGMSLRARVLLMFLAGLFGGVLTWMAVGRTGWLAYTVSVPGLPAIAESKLAMHRAEVGVVVGGLVGLMLGIGESFSFDRFPDRLRVTGCMLLAGVVFGALALQFGAPAEVPGLGLDAPAAGTSVGLASAQAAIARGVVWAVLGLGLGAVPGLLRRAPILIRQGVFGGVLGGIASGLVAMFVPPVSPLMLPDAGHIREFFAGISTLPAFLLGGAMIGLFTAGASYLFRIASLRIVVGAQVGKEYLLAAPVTLVGSGPSADIILPGDAAIAPSQCSLEESGDHIMLRPIAVGNGSFAATLVNGNPVWEPVNLVSGDEIHIGPFRLRFQSREQAHDAEPVKAGAPAKARSETNGSRAGAATGAATLAHHADANDKAEITEPVPVTVVAQVKGDTVSADITDKLANRELAKLHQDLEGPKLICIDGPYKDHVFMLQNENQVTIGRGSDRDIALVNDHAASREHAVIIAANDRHVIRDNGSANGTMLNNLPLRPNEPHRLESFDVILIGNTVLRYEI